MFSRFRKPGSTAVSAARPTPLTSRVETLEGRTLMAVSVDGAEPLVPSEPVLAIGGPETPVYQRRVPPGFRDGSPRTVAPRVTIAGRVFDDRDGDGVRDRGERGVARQGVFLDANGNGTADAGESVATTKASGGYTFRRLGAGTYTVRLSGDAASPITTPAQEPVTVTADLGRRRITAPDIGVGRSAVDAVPVSGTVYSDENDNGSPDPGEGLARQVTLGGGDSGRSYTVESDAQGRYQFPAVVPGTYVLHDAMPERFEGESRTTLVLRHVTIPPGGGFTLDFRPQTFPV